MEIINMLRGEDHWVVQDARGGLSKVWVPSYDVERLLDVHAGPISELCVAPSSHVAVTCGVDGSVRTWDIAKAENTATATFASPALCMAWAPETV